jgi:hypothetical protein
VILGFELKNINLVISYYIPLLLCPLLIFFFHLYFVAIKPRNKRFWKKVDYWWISFSMLGLIGSIQSFKREISTAKQPWHRQGIENVYDEYLTFAKSQVSTYSEVDGAFNYNSFEDKQQVKEYIEAAKFFEAHGEKIQQFKTKILNEYQYLYLDSLTEEYYQFTNKIEDQMLKQSTEHGRFFLEIMKENKDILLVLEKESRREEWDWLLLTISPYFLSIAIAIRITKVTAELVDMEKQKQ